MKLSCPNCHYKGFVDASAGEGVTCARCGTPMDELLWTGPQLSSLATTTTTTTRAAEVVDQRIMENQNAYAQSVEPSFDDVLEIPRPLKAAHQSGEQLLVLEDVIPVPPVEESSITWEELVEQDMSVQNERVALISEDDDDETLPAAPAPMVEQMRPQARQEILGAAEASTVNYEGYRAWVRMAPLLLLLGGLVFFSLYYLGNRIAERDQSLNAATNPASPPADAQSGVPATAPEIAQSPAAVSPPAESSVVGVQAESASPKEEIKAETVKSQTAPPPAAAPSATPMVATPAPASAPVASNQSAGNYTVQIGSYNNAAQAEERVARLGAGGIEARVVKAEIPRRGTWYRVQAGNFATQEEAARFAAQLKGRGATDDYIITASKSQ